MTIDRKLAINGPGRSQNAVSVIASSPIGLYGNNKHAASCDGFLAFPVASLGKDYYAVSYYASGSDITECGLVAIADGTSVTVTSPVSLILEGTTRPANTPFLVNMARY